MWQGALEDAKRTTGTWLWPGGIAIASGNLYHLIVPRNPGSATRRFVRSLGEGGRSGSSGQCLTHVAPRRLGNDYGNGNDVEEVVVV